MDINECKNKIEKYIVKHEGYPLVVDVQNPKTLHALITYFDIGDNTIVYIDKYCHPDEFPKIDDLFNYIHNIDGNIFIVGLSSFLKLYGLKKLVDTIKSLLNLSTFGNIVIFTYQCNKYFNFHDPRLGRRICIVDGNVSEIPHIICVKNEKFIKNNQTNIKFGIQNLYLIEMFQFEELYIISNKSCESFKNSLINMSFIGNAYDVISKIDTSINIDRMLGSDDEWQYALEKFKNFSNWIDVVDNEFANHKKLDILFSNFASFSNQQKWFFFISLKIFGAKQNYYLDLVVKNSRSLKEFYKNLYRFIITLDINNNYWNVYNCRKKLLNQIGNSFGELNLFCKIIETKKDEALYYLTDNTQYEKEKIFEILDYYGQNMSFDKICNILKYIYYDLYLYLIPYTFNNKLLDYYFQQYKIQKVLNKIFPEFLNVVNEQSVKREYNYILKPRISIFETLDRSNSILFFVDSLGVEYISYIKSLCNNLDMNIETYICRSEIPSITSNNKDFLSLFDEDKIKSIKELDEVKHHGKYNYDYYKWSKQPIHLIKELEIIKDIIIKIHDLLYNGEAEKVFIASDHGASRLAILHENGKYWNMHQKGEHSGRCCLKSEVDEKPNSATDAGDFFVLANYDRFKGGRKANVEVHGGALLEEVCIPILIVSIKNISVEIYLIDPLLKVCNLNKSIEIEVSYRKKAVLYFFSSKLLNSPFVTINNIRYKAQYTDKNIYRVDIGNIKKHGDYAVDIYDGDNLMAKNLYFTIKKEGNKEIDIL